MMKPRSAPVTSMAESSTIASTSSRTRPDPSARRFFEQGRHLAQLARRRHRAFLHRRRLVVDEEDNLGVPGLPEPNLIAVRQHPFAVLFAVDEGAEPRLLVADDADAVLKADLGVDARDVGPRQPQVGFAPASDSEQRLVDVDNAAPERVGDDKAGGRDDVGHEGRNYKP